MWVVLAGGELSAVGQERTYGPDPAEDRAPPAGHKRLFFGPARPPAADAPGRAVLPGLEPRDPPAMRETYDEIAGPPRDMLRRPDRLNQPVFRVAERPRPSVEPPPKPNFHDRAPNEHPLMPALRWAKAGLSYIESIEDYSATLVKRERINGELADAQYFFVKVRHKPFSVYVYFLTPESEKGQEVIYVDGKNNNNLVAHTVGLRHKLVGTVSLRPTGPIAMQNQKYPLTDIGLLNLTKKLIEVGESDVQYGECEVQVYEGAKVNDRVCTCLQFVHPVPRREFRYNVARVFVDDELNLPIRYEAYLWPRQAGGKPELEEEYTYLNLKLNNGFSDQDFDANNPNYGFGN
jgi:hypothetical protein